MTRTYITGVKVEQLMDSGALPSNLVWNHGERGDFPPSYSIVVCKGIKQSVVCASDGFGGGISYAITTEPVRATGKLIEEPLDKSEVEHLRARYPKLLATIEAL